MSSLLFVGLKGSGKSLIGKSYAARVGLTFVDVDEELLSLAVGDGLEVSSVRELYQRYGVGRFRTYEAEATQQIMQHIKERFPIITVVAAGGGLLENRWARREIQKLHPPPRRAGKGSSSDTQYLKIIYLERDSDWLYTTYQSENLPAVLSQVPNPRRKWDAMVRQRTARYRQQADYTIELGSLALPAALPEALHMVQQRLEKL